MWRRSARPIADGSSALARAVALCLAVCSPTQLFAERARPPRAAQQQRSGEAARARPPKRSANEARPSSDRQPAVRLSDLDVRGVRRSAPADDPAALATRLTIHDPPPGLELAELLAQVPGLRIRDFGLGQPKTLALRGATAHQIAVFLDGVRLTPPGGGSVDLSLFDPSLLGAVEVRRSGGSARFGNGALGGAVMLSSRRLSSRRASAAALGYGSWNALVARASHQGARSRLRYLASASYRRSDGDFAYRDHNDQPAVRANNDSRIGELLLKLDYPLARRWRLAALTHLVGAWRGAPATSFSPSLDARQRDLRATGAVQITRRDLLRRRDRLTLALSGRVGGFRFEQPPSAAQPSVRSSNQTLGGELSARYTARLADHGRLDVGLELQADGLIDSGEDSTGDHGRLLADGYISGAFGLWPGRLTLVPAVRLAGASDYGLNVVPKLGLVFAPLGAPRTSRTRATWWRRWAIVANIGRNLRYPTFRERFVRVDGVRGNPDLAPEDALCLDVGLRWRWRWLALEGAYFRRWVKSTILFAVVSFGLVRPDNFGAATAEGAEAALELGRGRLFGLSARAAYTFLSTRFGELESALPGQPRHSLVLRAQWSATTCRRADGARCVARWARGISLWSAVSLQSAMVLDRFDTLDEEGRALLSAGASYSYRWFTLSVEGRNLLDKRDAVDSIGFPLPPARFFVSLSAHYPR